MILAKNGFGYRFSFNGKEKDNEVSGDGNTIAFEARIYDSRLGRFFSTDPWEYKYAWQSTYAYYRNSPISQIDFLGMGGDDPPPLHGQERKSFMEVDDGQGGTCLEDIIEYWDATAEMGDGTNGAWVDCKPTSSADLKGVDLNNVMQNDMKYLNFYMSQVEFYDEVLIDLRNKINWVSQYDSRVPRAGSNACKRACYYMLESSGVNHIRGNANGIHIGKERSQTIIKLPNFESGINTLNSELDKGNHVIAGVARIHSKYWGLNYNSDGTTDHFVVIVGRINSEYLFYDPGSKYESKGASVSNIFSLDVNGLFTGTSYGSPMTITWIGRNK